MAVVKQLLSFLSKPSIRYSAGALILMGAAGAVIIWGVFSFSMSATSTQEFCISCHEMENHAYAEFRDTFHFQNSSGVTAECADCHIPHDPIGKIFRKIEAAREVYGTLIGKIDTPEKYEAHRLEMAEREWRKMKANDSANCRHCHSNFEQAIPHQYEWARINHSKMIANGQTCIDCHKGIAHTLPNPKLMKKQIPPAEPSGS